MATTLDRDDILSGLRALITELRSSNLVAGIRLVGGAALALRYFPRATTQDLDSLHIQPGSDNNDIRQLMSLCQIRSLDEAEELYEDFYPGDGLTDRAVSMVRAILDGGLPEQVPSPGPIEL